MYDEAKHRRWLLKCGLPYKGSSDRLSFLPATGCYVCKALLPLKDDRMCDTCLGTVCGHCGACLCGREVYQRTESEALSRAASQAKEIKG
jgi:hypothetical protein